MSRARAVTAFALVVAAATAALGWWMVPVVAAVWVRARPRDAAPAASAAAGAALGWALLLGWGAAHGPTGTLARRVGGVFLMPGWGLVGLTLAFAALLAAAAAAAAGGRIHRAGGGDARAGRQP